MVTREPDWNVVWTVRVGGGRPHELSTAVSRRCTSWVFGTSLQVTSHGHDELIEDAGRLSGLGVEKQPDGVAKKFLRRGLGGNKRSIA